MKSAGRWIIALLFIAVLVVVGLLIFEDSQDSAVEDFMEDTGDAIDDAGDEIEDEFDPN